MAQAKQDLQAIINAAAEKEGLDPELLQKIGGAESGFRAGAKNPKSTAKGLFQFVDKTWAEMGGKPGEQFIPQKNAELGARYVKRNKDTLTQALGREPSYGEVYAAHFFGPTGAKALLTKADPNAPIEQSLAIFESPKRVAKVLKQNPNLKGKTTAEVLADLDAKMGVKKPVAETPTVAAPTTPAKPSQGMFRRPVPRFIRSEAPNLGTGYNAALALMGLTEADEDPLTKAQETVAQAAEDDEVADFGQARQMLAQVQTPNAFANQQPRLMATGGDVKKLDRDEEAEQFFEKLVSAAKESAPLDLSFQSPPSQVVEGLGFVNAPPSVSGRIGTNFDALGGNVRIGAQGMAMQTPDKKILTMPGMYDIGYNTQVGPGNLDLSFQRQIQSMPGRGKDYAINAKYSYKFAEGGEAKAEPQPEKGSAKAMLKEVGRSTQYLPADIAGAPVDLINLGLQGIDALTGSKLGQKMPVGGAEWLIDKANKYGLMDKPTGSLTETLTRIGTSVVSPAAAVKSAAIAGGKAAGASRQALDEIYELSSASRAKKAAATAAEEAPVVTPKAAPAPVVEPAPKSQSRSMLDEIDPEIQKLINEPRVKGFEGPQQPKRTLTTPSPDRPFVSPLDKFFEKGNNPVTVEQLTNQLAKGSRDYEMSRVTKLLEGKSPKDKIRPADLLKQLEETSPARFRVQIKEPDPKNMGQFFGSMENPFPSKPMGTVNLLEDITPQENLASTFMRDLRLKKGFDYKASYGTDEDASKATSALEVFFKSPMAKEAAGQDLSAQFKIDAPKIRELNKKVRNIRQDMEAVSMPYSGSRRFGFDYFGEQAKIKQQALDTYPALKNMDDGGKTLSSVVDPILNNKAEEAILTALDTKYGTNLLGYKESMGLDWNQLSSYEKAKITERLMGDVVGSDFTKSQVALKELERPYEEVMRVAQANTTPYVGQHGSIADQKPISFSRFQDITLPTKENVMVIPELQSDRYDDLLKSGAKGGSQYQDMDELSNLEQRLDSVTRKLYKAGDAKDAALRDQLKLEGKKIEQRMVNLRERIAAGEYTTPEFVPGIERMPQVMQQIMIKNAVYAGIQRGKNGVLFPGSDSAQAQLYEKLPNNLRSVLKDLGSGFEIRKVPLTYEGGYPQGKTVDRYGIFWKDDAAKRISTEGVRFKKGGMVEKNDADNQKYI
jgi:hypothetical protein